jgi:hypothetical protein
VTPSDHEPTTQELRAIQARRATDESEMAETADKPEDERAHSRRAERAAYLRDKLDDQAEADADD